MLARLARAPERSNWTEPGWTTRVVGYVAELDTAESVFAQRAEHVWERGFARSLPLRPIREALQGLTYLAGLQSTEWRKQKWSEMAILALFRSSKLRTFEQCCVLLQPFEYPYSATILVRESS
jgi:hypothetical protein